MTEDPHLYADRLSAAGRLLHSAACWCWVPPQYGPSRWWSRRAKARAWRLR